VRVEAFEMRTDVMGADPGAEPGAAISRDIAKGEAAEASLDVFIEHRHRQRVETEEEGRAEEIWMESERKEAARRREENRGGWLDYYRRLEAGYLERAAECGHWVDELERTA
jgi:hypothetical protein